MIKLQKHLFYVGSLLLLFVLDACQSNEPKYARIPALPGGELPSSVDKSLLVLTEAIDDNPSNASYLYKRATIYLEQNKLDQALLDINKAIELERSNGKYYLARTRIYQQMHKPDSAFESIRMAEKLQVQTPEFYTLIGQFYFQKKQYEQANLVLTKSLQKAPYNAETFYWKGEVAAAMADTTNAIENFKTTLKYRPSDINVLNRLANIFTTLGDTAQAKDYAYKGLAVAPNHVELNYSLGNIYRKANQPDTAKYFYKKVVQLDSSLYLAKFQLAKLYLQEGSFEQAFVFLNKLHDRQNELPDYHFMLGKYYEKTGNKLEAMNKYELAWKENYSNIKAKNEYLKLKWALEHPMVKKQEALKTVESVPLLTPEIKTPEIQIE